MKRGTASRVILGKNTIAEMPGGVFVGTDVILGKKDGLTNDFNGLVLSNTVMLGKKVSHAAIISVIVRGTDRIVLPDAVANSLSYVKAFGGTEQRDIPDNYLQRQFIYMMDGSYIRVEDLPISAGYRVEFDFQTLTISSPLRDYIGGRAAGVSAGGGFRLTKLASSDQNRVVLYGFESGTEYYDPTTQFQANTRYKYTYNNGVCTLETGGSVVSTQTFTVTDDTSTNWGINAYANGTTWQTNSDGIYVYSLKVWNTQGELVMNLVPAVKKGAVTVVGFYDTVSGTFKTATAGTIAAGPDAVPTPDAPMDIVTNNGVLKYSKNLLDMSAENIVLGKYINNSGAVTDNAANFYNSKYIPVVAGEIYTWSTSSSISYFSVMEYDSGYVFKKRTLFSNAGTRGSITLDSDTAFVLIGANMDSASVTRDKIAAVDWQFEKGASATAYTPYGIYTDGAVETIEDTIGNTATAEMLLKVGNYQDEQEILSGNMTRRIGVQVLDGTEAVRGGTVANMYLFPSVILGDASQSRRVVCSHFMSSDTVPSAGNREGYAVLYASGRLLIGAPSIYSTEELFKQWLADQYTAGTPVIVVYPLAEPTTESVAGQTLQVAGGDNVLEITQASLTGLELEAQYNTQVQLTVQEVESANLDNDVTVTIL